MALRLVTGRSGSGKTRYILNEIHKRLQEDPAGPLLLLLVPEQATFQTEQALVAAQETGGSLRAQVLSFRRLAHRIMQETGGSAVVTVGELGRAMLIRRALAANRERLRLFRAETQGLAVQMNDLFTEWKRYGVSPEQAQIAAESLAASGADDPLLADKLHDLALVYRETERQLAGRWQDGEDLLRRLAENIPASSMLEGAEVWLDGFHGFTPQEFAVIGALLRRCRRVTVALCLDRPYGAGEAPDELELFHRTAETSRALCELAEAEGVPVEPPVRLEPEVCPRFAGSPELARLEAMLRGAGSARDGIVPAYEGPAAGGISVHAAANPRAEAEAAARDMIRRVREDGLRWRDMAVFVRQLDLYADTLRAVFDDYRIPYFLDRKASASHHPLVELVRSALETVLNGWRTEAVLRCVKTDLLHPADGSAGRDEADELENYVLAAGIDGRRWHDDGAWRPPDRDDWDEDTGTAGGTGKEDAGRTHEEAAGGSGGEGSPGGKAANGATDGGNGTAGKTTDGTEDGGESANGAGAPAETAGGRLRRIRDAFVAPLRRLERNLRAAETFRGLCGATYEFLEEIRAADRLERWAEEDMAKGDPGRSRLHRQVWDGMVGLMDQLVELAGEDPADIPLFCEMVNAGLDQLRLGVVPPALDAVLIGSPERTRPDRLQALYFLGVNDGVVPLAIREDGPLSEEERERLSAMGLRMAPGVRRRLLDERFLIYLALTAPSRYLWIGYPVANEEGEGLLPSELIRRLCRWFPGLRPQWEAPEPSPDEPEDRQLAHAAYPGRALTLWISQIRAWRQGASLAPGWWSVHRWLTERPEWRERMARLVQSLTHANRETPLKPETIRLLYGDRLRLSVSRMERFVACPFRHFAAHGLRLKPRRLYRVDAPDIGRLFHAALRDAMEKLLSGDIPEAAADWRRETAAAAERLVPRMRSEIMLSSHRHLAVARKLVGVVTRAGGALGSHIRASAFRPVALEVDFGPDGPLPPLTVDLGGGRSLDVIGRIDRIDVSDTPQGPLLRVIDYKSGDTDLALDEVAHGLSLQMLTYLDVAVLHSPRWLGRPAAPAGVLYFHVHNPLLHVANRLPPEEAEAKLAAKYRMKGWVLADPDAVVRMDASLAGGGKSSIVPVEIRKDGHFSDYSRVAGPERWELLRRAVRNHIRRIGGRIASGDVSISPYRMNRRSPCAHCEFRPVCLFDPALEGNRYHPLRKGKDREEQWRMVETAASAGEDGRKDAAARREPAGEQEGAPRAVSETDAKKDGERHG